MYSIDIDIVYINTNNIYTIYKLNTKYTIHNIYTIWTEHTVYTLHPTIYSILYYTIHIYTLYKHESYLEYQVAE